MYFWELIPQNAYVTSQIHSQKCICNFPDFQKFNLSQETAIIDLSTSTVCPRQFSYFTLKL